MSTTVQLRGGPYEGEVITVADDATEIHLGHYRRVFQEPPPLVWATYRYALDGAYIGCEEEK